MFDQSRTDQRLKSCCYDVCSDFVIFRDMNGYDMCGILKDNCVVLSSHISLQWQEYLVFLTAQRNSGRHSIRSV